MQKRVFISVISAVAVIAAACGGTAAPSPSPAATSAATTAASAAPAAKTVKIVSSLPRQGSSKPQTDDIVNAIKMAIEDNKIPNVTIQFEDLDDSTAAKQQWDATQEAENGRKAAGDKSIVAYIGTFNSGAAKVSIPILCQAGLVMVSPANTYPGLTKGPEKGAEKDEPGKYYPSGCKRNYTRVIPADDIQGAMGANYAKEIGAKKVFIIHDTQLYGKGIADVFRTKAKELGIQEVGYEGADKPDNYRAGAAKVKDSGADLVYYGGITQQNAAVVIKDIKAAVPNIKVIGPDGIFEDAFLKEAGPAAEGVFVTFAGIPPDKYTGKAKDWLDRYKAKFNKTPDVYGIYGYEAALVVIGAIKKAGDKADDRATVLANVFGTKDFEGVLGIKWSFDANGDTNSTGGSISTVKSGKFEFVKELK
jgi:branched-chain amino acid transport system substrate-binding protein